MKKLLERLRAQKAGLEAGTSPLLVLAAVKEILDDLLLAVEVKKLRGKVDGVIADLGKPQEAAVPTLPRLEGLKALESIVPTTYKEGRRTYLLHHLIGNSESYGKEAAEFETKAPTVWRAELGVSELEQERSEAELKGANPVVSCFIPEEAIVSVVGQFNSGTWGELGANPHKNKFEITVKPGIYKLHQELHQ